MSAKRLELNVMIEGQEGLTWERWQRLARAAEDGGFGGLYRSDHLTGLFGHPTRPSLETWASLAWLGDGDAADPFRPDRLPHDLLSAGDPGEARRGDRRAGRRSPRPRHRRRLERDGAPDVRHPLPAAPRAHGPPRVRRPGDPGALARRAGHARSALLPARRGAELPPPGGRDADRRRARRAADDAGGRRAGGRVERDPRDVRRLSAEARGPGRPLPGRRARPGLDPPVADGAHRDRSHAGRGRPRAWPAAGSGSRASRSPRRSGGPRASSSARWTRSCGTSGAGTPSASSASCSSVSTSTTWPRSSSSPAR